MAPSLTLWSPLLYLKNPKQALDVCLRFTDYRLKQKYTSYIDERSLSIIKILDMLIILGSVTLIVYLIISLSNDVGYEGLSFEATIVVTIVLCVITVIFIGLSIWLHYVKKIYSDLLLCAINTFSIVFLLEVGVVNSPTLNDNPKLYFSYSHRFGLMNLMFVICYKTWCLKVFQVCFGSVYFQARLNFGDSYSVCYNMILTAFCCFLFYFLEKEEKVGFKKMIESEKQNKSWKKILNTFPEGVAIAKEDKSLVFSNQSLKQILNEGEEEKLKQVLFSQIKRRGPSTSFAKFSSGDSNHSATLHMLQNAKEKDVPFQEIFETFVSKKIGSMEKIERQKSIKRGLTAQFTMKVQKEEKKPVFESFLSRLNDRVLEVKLAKFTYESSNHAFIIILSDITENLRLRMLEDNKAFKNSLFASFTHELRTPLNAFFLLSKTLLMQDSISDEIKTNIIDPIVFNAEILHNLINTISDYVAINMQTFKLQKTVLKFREFMTDNIRILSCLAKARNLQTELKLGDTLPEEVLTDENRIKQVLFQFYSNALKFTTKGCIKVSAKISKTNANRIIISVKDTGIGMHEKDMTNLAREINQQIDYINYERMTGSAGASLGLTVSNQIVKLLDKKPSTGIGFKSELGKGTKFFFGVKNRQTSKKVSYLNLLRLEKNRSSSMKREKDRSFKKLSQLRFEVVKLVDNHHPPSAVLNSAPIEEEGNGINAGGVYCFPDAHLMNMNNTGLAPIPKEENGGALEEEEVKTSCQHEPILIVDDDEFNIMAVTMLLKMKNLRCLAARNGQIAIDLIEEQCKIREGCCQKFGLIIMDLNMPVLNGIEASKRLNQRFEENRLPWMPIVMCTAYGSNYEGLSERYDSGIVEVVNKPLKIETLGQVIEKWM